MGLANKPPAVKKPTLKDKVRHLTITEVRTAYQRVVHSIPGTNESINAGLSFNHILRKLHSCNCYRCKMAFIKGTGAAIEML